MHQLREQSTDRGPLQLAWESGQAVVVSDDQRQLVKEAQRALLTRLDDLVAERFWRLFTDEFLSPIRQWCEAHGDRVAACYVPFPKDHLRVFVVTKSESYDFTLSPSDLEMDLFEKQWECEILQIPHGRLEMFFDPGASIQIYGNSG